MIPFGAWHPDAAGINSPCVIQAQNVVAVAMDGPRGQTIVFGPALSPVPVSSPLAGVCLGMTAIVQNSGIVSEFAGTVSNLYRFNTPAWVDVTRALGGYNTAIGERWRFAGWNPYVIATNYTDVPQKYDTSLSTPIFTALGGNPPRARFVDVVRDQVVLAGLFGAENTMQWSEYNNSEGWRTGNVNGSGGSDQIFPTGGPIKGFVGGPVGHVFQATRIMRMTLTPGASTIYQFDEVQGGKGTNASNSIVKVGDLVYYIAPDGPQVLSISTGQIRPIGVNKWRQWFLDDYRSGTESLIMGGYDPLNPVIRWSYVSNFNATQIPDRQIAYNWAIDEATMILSNVEAVSAWLSSSTTLDTLTPFGNLDTLPFSLDSPFWKGGVPLLGVIDNNHALNYYEGSPLAATITTADGKGEARAFIRAVEPLVDTTRVVSAVAMRERDGDATNGLVTFPPAEVMEDTGLCSAHTSGNVARAQFKIPAGVPWNLFKGVNTMLGNAGRR